MTITVIKNADVVVAWDADASRHVYLHGADVAFEDGTLRFVGSRYDGPATKPWTVAAAWSCPAWSTSIRILRARR